MTPERLAEIGRFVEKFASDYNVVPAYANELMDAARESIRYRQALKEIIADASCSAYAAQQAEAALEGK